jgi:hypothetical protein
MFGNFVKKIRAVLTRITNKKPRQTIESATFGGKAAQPASSVTIRRINPATRTQRLQPRNLPQKPLPGMPKNTRSQIYQNRLFDPQKYPDDEKRWRDKSERHCS